MFVLKPVLITMSKIQSILVTGATGQLGQSLQMIVVNSPQYNIVFASREEIDLSNTKSLGL